MAETNVNWKPLLNQPSKPKPIEFDWRLEVKSGTSACVIDRETGGRVADIHGLNYGTIRSRGNIVIAAPTLYRAFCDLFQLARKNLPEHLHKDLAPYEQLMKQVVEMPHG